MTHFATMARSLPAIDACRAPPKGGGIAPLGIGKHPKVHCQRGLTGLRSRAYQHTLTCDQNEGRGRTPNEGALLSTPSSGHGGWPSAPPPYGDYQGQPVVQQVFYGPGGPATAPVGTLPGDKSGGVAGLLSFLITGLGQVYTGDVGRGAIWFVAAVVGGALAWVIILVTFGIAAIILGPAMLAFWVWNIVDAVNCAHRRNSKNRMTVAPAAYGAVQRALPAAQPPAAHPYPSGQQPPPVHPPPAAPPPWPTGPSALPAPKYPQAPSTLALPAPSVQSKPPGHEDDFAVSLRPKSRPPAFCTECGHRLSPTDTSCPECGATP